MRFTRTTKPPATPAALTPADFAAVSAKIEAQVSQEFACTCEETEVRYRQTGRGPRHYMRQCRRCFKWSGMLPRAAISAREAALALPLDMAAREVWEGRRRRHQKRLLAEANEERSDQFWARYQEYLNSPAWKERARRVLERDGYLCQACLAEKATQAHHLTYERVFNEPLFDLVGVCGPCHVKLHGHG